MSVVIAIVVFCVIIVLHELGHFIAAKLCGIYVKEFALGMGPVIFKKKGKETTYALRAIPVGGFCSFESDFDDEIDSEGNTVQTEPNPRAYNRKPVWQRILVILAGPVMNLILGYIVVVISLCSSSVIASTTIAEFRDQSVSSSALMVNDEILSIDGMTVFSISDVTYKLQNSDRRNSNGNLVFDIEVKRNGEKLLLKDVEFMTMENSDGSTGVYFDFRVYRLEKTFGNIVTEAFRESASTARVIFMTLIDLISGKYGLNALSGPIGVGTVLAEAVSKYTFADLMYVISLITINVGVFNLVPIPSLDGGKLIFLIIEAIRRKPVKPQVEGMVHFVGFALLMLVMVIALFNDVSRLFTGG
ncbi:MAG: M50 family metallopeptidase [Oscillospiraceae bacterium]